VLSIGSSQSQYYSQKDVKKLEQTDLNKNNHKRFTGVLYESYKSFDMLRNVIQNEMDKINIGHINDGVKQGKRIFIDENIKDLWISRDIPHFNYVDHYIMFRGLRTRFRSSANLSFNYRYMNKIEHTFMNNNYIYPKQMYMNNVIAYVNKNGISYLPYDPQTFTINDVYVGCDTDKVNKIDFLFEMQIDLKIDLKWATNNHIFSIHHNIDHHHLHI
jgi:hypothetical protein